MRDKEPRRQWVIAVGVALLVAAVVLWNGPLQGFGVLLGGVGLLCLASEALLRN